VHVLQGVPPVARLRNGGRKPVGDAPGRIDGPCRRLFPSQFIGSVRFPAARLHAPERLLRRQRFLQLLHHEEPVQGESVPAVHRHRHRMAHARAGMDPVRAFFQHVRRTVAGEARVIIGSDARERERDHELFRFTRRKQPGLRESSQRLHRFAEFPLRRLHVHLHHFFARVEPPGIRHLHAHVDAGQPVLNDAFRLEAVNRKIGVGKPEPERIPHLLRAERLKITVPDVNVFLIHVFLFAAVIGGGRIIADRDGDGVGQLAAWRRVAGQHVGDGVAAFHAAVPGVDDGRNRVDEAAVVHPLHVDDVGNVEHDDRFVKMPRHRLQHRHFLFRQVPAARRRRVVLVFAGGAADDDHRLVGFASGVGHQFIRKRHFLLVPRFLRPSPAAVVKGVFFHPFFVDPRQIFVDPDFRFAAQPVQQVGRVGHVHAAAGTGAAPVIIDLDPSEHRDAVALGKREHPAVVFQKNGPLGRDFPAEVRKPFQRHADHRFAAQFVSLQWQMIPCLIITHSRAERDVRQFLLPRRLSVPFGSGNGGRRPL